MRKTDADVIKNSKPFQLPDLLIYLLAAVMIFSLFLCCNTCNAGAVETMSVSRGGETLFSYDFSAGSYRIYSDEVSVREENGVLLVTIATGEEGFNVVEIDRTERAFFVKDANCSARKDCVHSPAVKKAGQSAVCAPHSLVFKADGGEIDRPVVG